jgi:phosphopentomutase
VYTSGDSVFQVAAHEDVVPLETLYEWCRAARDLLTGEHLVGRVIARPFRGRPGRFERTPGRRDLSLEPPGRTLLDAALEAGVAVYGVGKVQDVFAGRGITEGAYSDSNDQGLDLTLGFLDRPAPAFVFANLVDFDSKYGHRNDPEGYAACVEAFDARVPELLEGLGGGVLFVTGDHGCDPTTASTDHSRETTPLLAAGLRGGPYGLGARGPFGVLGATVGQLLGIDTTGLSGTGFASDIGF